jgi:hypothetical protein
LHRLAALLLTLSFTAVAWADGGPAAPRRLVCPIDGAATFPVGNDGQPAPRTYSDLEVPTEAYTSLVVACPKCGYANWVQEFQTPVDGATAGYVHQHLQATAARAGNDPLWAFKHHLALLDFRQAGLRERIGAHLFYSYVLKRRRPLGGQDPEMEREILSVRKHVLEMLEEALRVAPPKQKRGQLEWQYLTGELLRLTGEVKRARPWLKAVCEEREEAGYLVGRMACEVSVRAERGETIEDYRDGVYDVGALPPPGTEKKKPLEPVKNLDGAEKKPEPQKPLPPMTIPPPPRNNGNAPPPPPPAG